MLQGFKEDKYILVVQSKTNTDLLSTLYEVKAVIGICLHGTRQIPFLRVETNTLATPSIVCSLEKKAYRYTGTFILKGHSSLRP